MAAVTLDGGSLIPYGEPSDREFLVATESKIASTANPDAPQRLRAQMLAKGLYPGKVPYPYIGKDGYITVGEKAWKIVECAFQILAEGGSYTEVASELNHLGHKTSTGKTWNKDTARTFCQNPVHAGFAVSYKDRRKNGSADKRGDLILTRLAQGFTEPLIDLDTWLSCNPVMAEREIILVFPK
jgi:hypothetical protein